MRKELCLQRASSFPVGLAQLSVSCTAMLHRGSIKSLLTLTLAQKKKAILMLRQIPLCQGNLLGARSISEDPLHEGCAGADKKASPPGRHQEQPPKHSLLVPTTT